MFGYAQQKPKAIPDSLQVKSNILTFYRWYNNNWRLLAAFELYKSKKGREGPPYTINWKEAEASFSYLRKEAPFLGTGFGVGFTDWGLVALTGAFLTGLAAFFAGAPFFCSCRFFRCRSHFF